MAKPHYKRVLLKISGEALAGDASRGLDFNVIGQVCDVIKECVDLGVEVGIVVGGGNFWRGLKDGGDHMERTRADHMGMLATVINALAIADCLEQRDVSVRVDSTGSVAVIYAEGKAVAFIEFGSGIKYGYGHTYADELGMGPGTYPEGKGHWDNPDGWYYAHGKKSYGNPPAMAMAKAIERMTEELTTIAREVFGH